MSKRQAFNTLPRFITKYFEMEGHVVTRYVHGNVLDVGAGPGRAIPFVAQSRNVTSYTAIEPDFDYNRELVKKIPELSVKTELKSCTFDEVAGEYDDNQFDTSLLLWNTLSMWQDPKEILEPLHRISKSVFMTVIARGNLEERLHYYNEQKILYTEVDPKIEMIVSDQWEKNRAYDLKELREMLPWPNILAMGNLTNYCHYIAASKE